MHPKRFLDRHQASRRLRLPKVSFSCSRNTVFSGLPMCLFWVLLISGCLSQVDREVKRLDHKTPGIRLKAVEKLADSDDPASVVYLITAMKNKDPQVVLKAIDLLAQKKEIESAVPILIELLNHPDSAVSYSASETLINLNSMAVAPLILRLKNQNPDLVMKAAETLGSIGDPETVLPLIDTLKNNPSDKVRIAAVTALGKIGDIRSIPPLISAMELDDSAVPFFVSETLAGFGPPALKPLINTLKFKNDEVVNLSVEILGRIGNSHTVAPLVSVFKTTQSDAIKMATVRALGKIGSARAIPFLVELLTYNFPAIQKLAAKAILCIGDHAVDPLIQALYTKNMILISHSALLLGQLRDKKAVPPLVSILEKADYKEIRISIITALGQIGDKAAVPSLLSVLEKIESDKIVLITVKALENIRDPRATLPFFHIYLKTDPFIQTKISSALIAIGEPAVKPLILILLENNPDFLKLASNSLIKIGKPSIEPLIHQFKKNSPETRKILANLAKILISIGEPAVIPLIETLTCENPEIRNLAAASLGKIGDKRALTPLVKSLTDRKMNLSAAHALDALGWKPSGSSQRIHYLVAKNDMHTLLSEWKLTLGILGFDIQNGDKKSIKNSVHFLLGSGKKDAIREMANIIKNKCKAKIAEIYLNSGNPVLIKAAGGCVRSLPSSE